MKSSASQIKDVGLTQEMFEQLLAWLDEDRDRAGKKYEEIRLQLITTYVGDPALYFYGVAKMIYLEYVRSKPAPLPDSLPQSGKDSELMHECLEQCIDKLSPTNRELILAYYGQGQANEAERGKMAARMGLELNALWVRVHRIREKLRGCVIECLNNREAR
jgi:hypothetical protein